MNQQLSDRRDIEFVLFEQLQAQQIGESARFSDFSRKTMGMILAEARSLAQKEIVPTNPVGDREGCILGETGVQVPPDFQRAWNLLMDGGWISMSASQAWSGQGMPKVLATAAAEILAGANNSLFLYAALTQGAAGLVESFGTEAQKATYLNKMFSGQWTGTMLLTEPCAGSDLGALETSARKNPDGTYSITGEKIFISGGDHNMAENIIHPVLARIEGAPAGSKGISLFLVPKYRIRPDGTPGDFNNVVCTGLEHKMGIHGNATCTMSLGAKGESIGELLGKENKGLKEMFQMMNEERVFVGLQGLSLAACSYGNALQYARERIQGSDISADPTQPPESVPIIRHPDIRRQLMLMKGYVEASRSLLLYSSLLEDKAGVTADETEKERLAGIADFMIPIIKAYITDCSFNVCSMGLQIFGGYGFTEEYPQSQLLRDCRITMIYEGTNGIQAIDLLTRKLLAKDAFVFNRIIEEIRQAIQQASSIGQLAHQATVLDEICSQAVQIKEQVADRLKSPDFAVTFAYAYPFMEVLGDLIFSWMLLWRAIVAARKLEQPGKEEAYLAGQILSATYFIDTVLPVTRGKIQSIITMNDAPLKISDKAF